MKRLFFRGSAKRSNSKHITAALTGGEAVSSATCSANSESVMSGCAATRERITDSASLSRRAFSNYFLLPKLI
ncbi:MAG: hypothetical protein M3367_04570 [Acidobacteriota bacterium]|nr:hypothetical protein [Acidobacteriota bacterium]